MGVENQVYVCSQLNVECRLFFVSVVGHFWNPQKEGTTSSFHFFFQKEQFFHFFKNNNENKNLTRKFVKRIRF